MGQILSWIKGSGSAAKEEPEPGLRDVTVEEQSQSVTSSSSKAAAPVATYEVQVEVPPKSAPSTQPAPLVDPLDLLASSLPSEAPKRPEVIYSGPEVTEPAIPADAKPAEIPKALSTDDALDLLSDGFSCETKPQASSVSAVAAAVDQKPKKNQAQVHSPTSEALTALGGLLPSAEPSKPEPELRPQDIVPEVTVEEEEGVRVGEREDTLPPEYRLTPEEIARLPPAPKPEPGLDTAEALDILSGDFCDSKAAPKAQKVQPVSPVSPAPPVDKKPRMESNEFSLEAGVAPSSAQKVAAPLPPLKKTEAKAKTETKPGPEKPRDSTDSRAAAAQNELSLDALTALGGLLPSAEPKKPELRPQDIVSEVTVEEEEGVRVGEREDTLPPEYRLTPEDIARLPPAPKPEPGLDTAEALDILSGDFCDSKAAPKAQTAQSVQPTAPPVESLSALDSLAQDFVSPTKGAAAVQAQAPPTVIKTAAQAATPTAKTTKTSTVAPDSKNKPDAEKLYRPDLPQQGSMSDALSALEDLLPSAEPPKPESALVVVDITTEEPVEEEEGVRVGEREDTLPPEYRLTPEDIARLPPAPRPEPGLDTAEALDILSGDFCDSKAAPKAQTAPTAAQTAPTAAQTAPTAAHTAPAQSSTDAALDALAGDFVSSSAAPTVQSSSCPADGALGAGADSALDALSDALKDIAPTPQPEPPLPKDIVKEKQIEEERLIKMGERDDTLPPEYRPTEEELKKMLEEKKKVPEPPKEKPMDDKTALDLLAGDFSCPAPSESSASAQVSSTASTTVSSTVSSSVSSSPAAKGSASAAPPTGSQTMSGKVLDSLSETLLPDDLKTMEKPKKSPAEGATEPLSSPLSSDLLPKKT